MSNLLTVVEPDENASEVATETRAKLQEWGDKHFPDVEAKGITALSDAQIKELRATGAEALLHKATQLAGSTAFRPVTEFGKLLAAFAASFSRITMDTLLDNHDKREFSHALEGAVREFHKQFFQGGMQWNTHAEWLSLVSMQYPHSTGALQDHVYRTVMGVNDNPGLLNTPRALGDRHESEWYIAWKGIHEATQERFKDIAPWLVERAVTSAVPLLTGDAAYYTRYTTSFNHVGVQVHYMDEDGPWVAGFLNLDDAARLKFRRIRLGAYLTEQGMDSDSVRTRVEKAKQQVAGAKFYVYPNDVEWDEVYTGGVSSCMADEAGDYETWDGIHPVSAYSSSYHGSGDNSLALVVTKDEDTETITGRGILNLQRGTIVRWYGDNVAERVLLRNGVKVDDHGTLEDSWLAYINKGKRFIHPYVDGDCGTGEINSAEKRVYIRPYSSDDGMIELQSTEGSSYAGEVKYCVDVEVYRSVEECTYQPLTDTYVSDELSDGWRCPVTQEYARSCDRTPMTLHGVQVEVADYVYYHTNEFLTKIGDSGWGFGSRSSNWSIDDEDIREAFFDEHGIDEQEESDEDEEAA